MTNPAARLSIAFSTPAGNQSFEQALAVAHAAEAAGFASVAFGDRPHDPGLDGWTLATAVAARTERIRLWHTTLNLPYRYPAVLAKEAATLDRLSGGRLDLCLGAGGEGNRPLYDSIGVPLGAPGERLTDLEDGIAILRGLWVHERFSYAGRAYRVEDAPGTKPAQLAIPIWIGARLPRSLRMTGRIADGYIKNGGWGSVEELAEMNRRVDAAAERAGRDPGALRHILNGSGYLARDRADAEAIRAQAAAAPPGAGGARPAGGLVGTAEEVLELIRAYRAAGVDMFTVRFLGPDPLAQIARWGSEIVPAVAALWSRVSPSDPSARPPPAPSSGCSKRPDELKLHFLIGGAALVLNVDHGACRDRYPLPGHLDSKRRALIDAVGQAPQLGRELPGRVVLDDVPLRLPRSSRHSPPPSIAPRQRSILARDEPPGFPGPSR